MKDEAARTPEEGPAPASRAEGVAGPSSSVTPSSAPEPQQGEAKETDEADLADVERERDEYLELARRTKADFENYRKRISREASEAEARGRAGLARELLSVVDNLERALAAAEPRDHGAPNHIAEGVRLVYEELSGVLANAGISSFEPTGEQFDPDQHEAMLTRPGNEGKILEVFQKGYRLNGQVLRPARVVVGSADDENLPCGGKPTSG
jgi:molecular chaperone GrpE